MWAKKRGIKSPAVFLVGLGGDEDAGGQTGMLGSWSGMLSADQGCWGPVQARLPTAQPSSRWDPLLSLGSAGKRRPPRPPQWCQFWKMAFDSPIKLSWSDQKGPPETGRLTRSRKSKQTIHLATTKFSKWRSLESNRIHWYQIFSLSTAYAEPGLLFSPLCYRKM